MDWGFITITREGKLLKRKITLFPIALYVFAFFLNFFLRFSWLLNRFPGFEKLHSSIIILIIEIGEIIRRSIWNLIRIEWEILLQQDKVSDKQIQLK